MRIRDVTREDLPEICALEKRVFGENALPDGTFKKLIKYNLMFLKLEQGEDEKKLVGFITVIKDRDERANVVNFVIDTEFQNKGYGTLLLEKTIETIDSLDNINQIVLNVSINNVIAIKLYEKFGFRIIETIEKYYASGENAYLMQKRK